VTAGPARPIDRGLPRVPPPAPVLAGTVGVMGGTFDPIHLGHLAAAEEARERLGLERILFIPARIPPHKQGSPLASAADRLAMVERAVADNPAFEASSLELERDAPSYTIDTIEELIRRRAPGGHGQELPTLILSLESFRDLNAWREPLRLVSLVRVAVLPRDELVPPHRDDLEARFPGLADHFTFLDRPRLDISSTAIRARVAAGRSIRYLVPSAVAAWIVDHDLYRDRPPGRADVRGADATDS
jgi:nicotinate-nucleotide adenylyltransferase